MPQYIDIIWTEAAAGPKAVEYDRCMIVGDGSPSTLTESKIYEVKPDNWEEQLEADGFTEDDQIYNSTSVFFSPTTPPARAYVYAYVSGAEVCYTDMQLNWIGGNMWTIPQGPPRRFGADTARARFYGCGEDIGTGFTWNYADGSQGLAFTPETDGGGNWTGKIEFPNGLSGADGIVKPVTSDCKVTVDYCMGAEGGIGQAITQYNINMVSLALENNSEITNYTDNIFGSQLQDIMKMSSIISGKNCIWFYSLPGNAGPDTTIDGTSNTWSQLKNLIGARADIAVIKGIHSALNHDMATGYMAMTAVSHPHMTLTLARPHMGIQEAESGINETKWDNGQIAYMIQWTDFQGDPFFVSFGYTFGSGDVGRIEGIRCRYIIGQTVVRALKSLLSKRTTLMSYEGCQTIKSVIRGAFKLLIDARIADGIKRVHIPIENDLRDNTEAGKLARRMRMVPVVEIEYEFFTSVERIRITRAENVAL